MALSKEQSQLLNELYTDNSLTKDDVFDSGQYKIITRSGIEKIQYKNGIKVTFEPIHMDIDFVVVKATGVRGDKTIETFGEWNRTHAKKKQNGDIVPFYSVALAEKRALSRVVLKLMGLYEFGFKGEDEDMFQEGDDPADQTQLNYIEDLLRNCSYSDDWKEAVENNLGNLTKTGASKLIADLKNNQIKDPVKDEAYRGIDYLKEDLK